MKKTDVLFQHGTLALLVPGLLEGTMSLAELMEHGDTGIGTGEGLDGELIIFDGKAYQVSADGKVTTPDKHLMLPYANCHFADFIYKYCLKNIDMEGCYQRIGGDISENLFYSIKISGTFDYVKSRAVAKQMPPYPGLNTVIAGQKIFEAEKITGTAIGYFSPALYHGIATGGFHLHFMAEPHNFGGHILDFSVSEADVFLQKFSRFEQTFPVNSVRFTSQINDYEKIMSDLGSTSCLCGQT